MKPCSKCKLVKPLVEFYPRALGKDGLMPTCKLCHGIARKASRAKHRESVIEKKRATYAADPVGHRAWALANAERHWKNSRRSWLKKKYGMTVEQYEAKLESQDGCCAICRVSKPGGLTRYGAWNVDHDHETGAVRGLLCRACNMMLGSAGESTSTLLSAVDYLIEHGAPGMVARVA